MLNPTPFIQSTHNTISSQIALMLKCHGYNSTYAGRGACFETGMLDATMMISDKEASTVLVGAYDELINNQITILYRLGLFRGNNKEAKTSGNTPGEGASFFVLSDKQSENDYAKITGMEIFSNSKSVSQNISEFLIEHSVNPININSILLGNQNHNLIETKYNGVENLFPLSNILWFKHLCGEYMTSSAFAIWLASNVIKSQIIPESIILKKSNNLLPENILVINNIPGNQLAVFLLTK
jgi:3-oxoacyl-(acyl-carrier-protein) synthase